MFGGSSKLERNVIQKFHETLEIDKEIEIQIKYLELSIKQYPDCITMDQRIYINVSNLSTSAKKQEVRKCFYLENNN